MLFLSGLWWSATASAGEAATSDSGSSLRDRTTEGNSKWMVQKGSPAKLELSSICCLKSLDVEALE